MMEHMTLSKRNKLKHIEKAMSLLPQDGARPIDYAVANAGSMPSRQLSWLLLGGWLAVSVVLSAATGAPFIIGGLPLLAVYYAINQPRGLLLTDHGIALLQCGFLNGRPNLLVSLNHASMLTQRGETRAGATHVRLGNDLVWVRDADLHRLQTPAAPLV